MNVPAGYGVVLFTVVGAILFGAHVLAPIDPAPAPAPATSTRVVAAPRPSPSTAPLFDDFDAAKKYHQIDWCERHHGIPDMTFTRDKSNVLCLRPEAVIPLPAGELE